MENKTFNAGEYLEKGKEHVGKLLENHQGLRKVMVICVKIVDSGYTVHIYIIHLGK